MEKLPSSLGPPGASARPLPQRWLPRGASVALLYAGNTARAEEVCARCAGYGVSARSYQCDVSDFAQVKQTIAAIKKDFGGASILVNNAGINRDGLIAHDEGIRF